EECHETLPDTRAARLLRQALLSSLYRPAASSVLVGADRRTWTPSLGQPPRSRLHPRALRDLRPSAAAPLARRRARFAWRLTFAFCRAALSAERRGVGVGQQRAVRTLHDGPAIDPKRD